MAKKVVATLRTGQVRGYTKVIKMVKSEKTNAYCFKERIMPADEAQSFFKK
jgi:hypothetical protein